MEASAVRSGRFFQGSALLFSATFLPSICHQTLLASIGSIHNHNKNQRVSFVGEAGKEIRNSNYDYDY